MQLLISAALLVAWSSGLSREPFDMSIEVSGAKSGSQSFELKADGSFVSNTELNIGSLRIAEKMAGKFEAGKLVRLAAEMERPGQPKAAISIEGGKLVAVVGDKRQEKEFKDSGKGYFSSFHPQLFASTLAGVNWEQKSAQEVEVLVIEGGSTLKISVAPKKERTAELGVARIYLVKVGTVEIEYALDAQKRVVAMDVPSQRIRLIAKGWEGLYVDPIAAYPELSQRTHKVTIERGVKMKTRDGVELVSDVFRPVEPGTYPAILTRTPYGRAVVGLEGEFYASRGYVFVAQDVRGMGDSSGAWDPFVNERKDGYDAIDWVSKAPWSNGKVGMIGASYGGLVQWAAAVERHPALKCLVPQVSPPDAMRNIPYDHGTFFLFGSLWWSQIVRGSKADLSLVGQPLPNLEKIGMLPLSKVDDALFGQNLPFFDLWLGREGEDKWQGFDWLKDVPRTDVPALHISGWWDGDGIGTKRIWERLRSAGRKNQWLIYGPWTHAFNTSSTLGDIDYGSSAILDLDPVYVRWFDTWLKGKNVGLGNQPKVRVFVTGANRWVDLSDWPDARSRERTLYLYADAPANGRNSQGELRDEPAKSQEPSRYVFNPANVDVPEALSTMDTSKATTKLTLEDDDDDTLVFRTEALKEAMAIGGPIRLDLHFQTSARDTDFYASIVDVDPKGEIRQIGMSGKLRAAFLGGMDRPRPLVPNRTYRATVDLWDTAHEFKPGHRLGVLITSGLFPMYARNLGTGEPIKDATRMVVQANAIFHDSNRPSTLRFQILP